MDNTEAHPVHPSVPHNSMLAAASFLRCLLHCPFFSFLFALLFPFSAGFVASCASLDMIRCTNFAF
jgi:hypothetical protein